MDERIENFYPEAHKALKEEYRFFGFNPSLMRYRMVVRFCKCNFGTIDRSRDDIDMTGLNFEHVSCPLRGECRLEGIVCHPKFDSKISKAEERVLKLLYEGLCIEDIAARLYLSPLTCRNHIRNAYTRLGLHDKAGFIKYADNHNLFR